MKNITHSPTPRTDAKIIELDMQDLSIGHKLRENQSWARELERELHLALDALHECQSARARLSDPVVDARNSIEP